MVNMFHNIFFQRKGLRKPLRKSARIQAVAWVKKIRNLCIGSNK